MSNVRAANRRMQAGRTYGSFTKMNGDHSVGWYRTFSLLPRKTVGGQYSIGPMFRRITTSYYNDFMNWGPSAVEYATEKELFKSKLLGVE